MVPGFVGGYGPWGVGPEAPVLAPKLDTRPLVSLFVSKARMVQSP
jgi:hypothetical protein